MPRLTIPGAVQYLPSHPALSGLRKAAQACRGCALYAHATQVVMGKGPSSASIVLVGEQPGDQEDQHGAPFVGPAGRLLDRAVLDAGIDREAVYVTNAVKHFKFEERGKRRIHKKPSSSEINACRPWLETEISLIRPRIIVCLGATAAQSILGRGYRLTRQRGQFVEHPWAPYVTSTIHPSAILRAPDEARRHLEYENLVRDLKLVRDRLRSSAA